LFYLPTNKSFPKRIIIVFAIWISVDAMTAPTANMLFSPKEAEGYWELDPNDQLNTSPTVGFRCNESPLRITIDVENLRYKSVIEGTVANADILEIGANLFWIKYDDEDRLDDLGNPVEWAWVRVSTDKFYWVRRDWQIASGGRTFMRRRCPQPDMVS
jgi:hypothetical protein